VTRRIAIKGFTVRGDGRLIKDLKRLDVSARLRMSGSKRVRVVARRKAQRT